MLEKCIPVSECPEVLFEVKCSEHKLCIGGVPWHYIITPVGSHGIFRVHSLATKALVCVIFWLINKYSTALCSHALGSLFKLS